MDADLAAMLTDRLIVRKPVSVDGYGRRVFRGPFTTAFSDAFGPDATPCRLQVAEAAPATPDSQSRDSRVRGSAFVAGWLDVDLDDEVMFTTDGTDWFAPPLLGITHWSDDEGNPDHTVLTFGDWRA